ncbi:hypothetical protein [Parachitinimonas caeni]|uniref:DUF3592 domain-containing protein n=1 Tax=Parachitinimonas caeni TaxID=3031301 RepID=A0ABT7DV38_9NEIS|nr:hypothetical protein [Parachitinimonas caeni]MDK2123913.1 hypothetical protein [Parachitinimonas caeni]
MPSLSFSPAALAVGVVVLLAILVHGWLEMRRTDQIIRRRRQLRAALESFEVERNVINENGEKVGFVYAYHNSRKLIELENSITDYGSGTAKWLFYLPERKIFFILEFMTIEPPGPTLQFLTTIHPIKPDRARQLLSKFPEIYKRLFREEI